MMEITYHAAREKAQGHPQITQITKMGKGDVSAAEVPNPMLVFF
jgi:hypothetical protein